MNLVDLTLNAGEITLTGQYLPAATRTNKSEQPLIVALHGGTFTAKYFDIEGFSLFDVAHRLGLAMASINRPCYAQSGRLSPDEATIINSAKSVTLALTDLWRRHGGGHSGIVLIGHSIGGAVAVLIASMARDFPLRGISISGAGVTPPAQMLSIWETLPDLPELSLPDAIKDTMMLGPETSYPPQVAQLYHVADFPAPRKELFDIYFEWPRLLTEVGSKVDVPVHYRQPEFDALWVVNEAEIKDFTSRFPNVPLMDAGIFRGAGHCIEFHHLGQAFQLEQLAFAMRCAAL